MTSIKAPARRRPARTFVGSVRRTINLKFDDVAYSPSTRSRPSSWSANLYLDGDLAAVVAVVDDEFAVEWCSVRSQETVERFFADHPHVKHRGAIAAYDLETWCREQLQQFLAARELGPRLADCVMAVTSDGRPLVWKALRPENLNANTRALIERQYPGIVILNGLDLLEAARIFLRL